MNWTDFRKKLSSLGNKLSSKVKKYKTKITISGVAIATLLGILLMLPGSHISTSGDILCGVECNSTINYTNTQYDIKICNITELGINVYFDKAIKDYQIYLKDQGEWKTNTTTCIERKKGEVWEFLLVGHKNAFASVKWGVKIGNSEIDPTWFGGKLEVNKSYVVSDIDHFVLDFNLSSTVDYELNASTFRMLKTKVSGINDVSYFEFRIKTPVVFSNVTKSFTCENPLWFNYTTNHLWCWENYTYSSDNITFFNATRLVFEHDFETYNFSARTIYWNDTQTSGGVYVKFNPIGKTIQAGEVYELEFFAAKKPELGQVLIHFDFLFDEENLNMTWWNTSFSYKKQINFTNPTNATNEYWPRIILNSTNIDYTHTDNLGRDIRVIDQGETTALPHYTQLWNESGNSIERPRVPVGNTSVWIYYGNATPVSSTSNKTTTFYASDTGELSINDSTPVTGNSTTLFGWTSNYATGANWKYDSAIPYSGTLGWNHTGANQDQIRYDARTLDATTFEYMMYDPNMLSTIIGLFQRNSTAWSGTRDRGISIYTTTSATKYVSWDGSSYAATSVTRSVGWHRIKHLFVGSRYLIYIDDVLVVNTTAPYASNEIEYLIFDVRWDPSGNHTKVMFDDLLIYNVTSALEINYSIGSEQTNLSLVSDLNLSFGPSGITLFQWEGCDPDFENVSALPYGQNSTHGIDLICNNGTATGNVDLNLSGTPNANWTIWASNVSNFASNRTLSNGVAQRIYNSLTAGSCVYIWFKANCSFVSVGPGVYEKYFVSDV